MRKIAFFAIGALPAGSIFPTVSYITTLPWRATTSTAPGSFFASTSAASVVLMRASRSDDIPTASGLARGSSLTCANAMDAANSGRKNSLDSFIPSSLELFAPILDDGLVDRHRLPDAFHVAVFVGLVRHRRLAGPEHHRRRADIDLAQVGRVRHVGRGARHGRFLQDRLAQLEHALHPRVVGFGPHRLRIREYLEFRFIQNLFQS